MFGNIGVYVIHLYIFNGRDTFEEILYTISNFKETSGKSTTHDTYVTFCY